MGLGRSADCSALASVSASTGSMTWSRVAIVHWPRDAAVADWLRARGWPRLLLVSADAEPPSGCDWNEDWIRLPSSDNDIRTRAAALEARRARRGPGPEVKGDGRLCFEGRWVGLSQTEEAMVRVLSERFGEVVDPHSLATSLASRRLSPNSVRVHLARLRRRIAPLGLMIRTVRGRGFVLDPAGSDDQLPIPLRTMPALAVVGPAPRPGIVTSGAVFTIGDLVVDGPRRRVAVGGRPVGLSPTEFRLLSVLAQHPGELVPYRVILDQVWGGDVEDINHLRVCASQIRKKLNDDPARPRLITERRRGYRLVDPSRTTSDHSDRSRQLGGS